MTSKLFWIKICNLNLKELHLNKNWIFLQHHWVKPPFPSFWQFKGCFIVPASRQDPHKGLPAPFPSFRHCTIFQNYYFYHKIPGFYRFTRSSGNPELNFKSLYRIREHKSAPNEFTVTFHHVRKFISTARKRSLRKVMFSQASVCSKGTSC